MSKFAVENYDPERSKKQGYKAATKHLVSFLKQRLDNLQQNSIIPELFENFSNHLLNLKYKDDFYCFGTVLQYVSGVYNVLKQRHPRLALWQENLVVTDNSSVPQWYNTLRGNISRIVTNRVIQSGEKLQNKSEPIGRNLLIQMTHALLSRNDIDAVEMATTFVWDFSSCGRFYISFSCCSLSLGLAKCQLLLMAHAFGMMLNIH